MYGMYQFSKELQAGNLLNNALKINKNMCSSHLADKQGHPAFSYNKQ